MKLSHKSSHKAPRLRTRDLRGKLHNPPAATNSNRPGGRFSFRLYREGFFSSLRQRTGRTNVVDATVALLAGARSKKKVKVMVVGKGDK